jgi:hypothetical protein
MKKLSVLCVALFVGLSTAAAFARGGGMGSKGPALGTNPAIDREEAKVDKMIGSICRGC